MKYIKLIIGIIFIFTGFLAIIADEIPGEPINISKIIAIKIIGIILLLIGYKLLISLKILNEYTESNK
jgi:hypothetical protein